MRVPKYIQDKLHRLARLNKEANNLCAEINAFFTQKGIKPEHLHNVKNVVDEQFPDYLADIDNGVDATDELVKFIENYY